jgi:ATP-dependent Clp protease ATP-binding subunit ClpA
MLWHRLRLLLLAAIGDDGTGPLWQRLTPQGREVIRLASAEARDLGHPCLAGEHLLLGVLREGTSPAAALLHANGLDLPTVRAELLRIGASLSARADPAEALRALGIEVDDIRRRLAATFGPHAVRVAERRVRRRPRWRGGHPRPRPLCAYLLARRSLHLATWYADRRGDTGIGPEHLLYGVLRDARDPLGTQVSRRGRRRLAVHGWAPGRPNPLRLMLEARGLHPAQLATRLGG